MGLDQYLHAQRYLSPTWGQGEERQTFHKLVEAMNFGSLIDDQFPSCNVSMKVAYWRKANQIHDWFVENVQDGEDNCAEYHVSRETLQELVTRCDEVLEDPSKAEELLPTSEGFFYGSTDYDEFYLNDLKYTSSTLKRLLAEIPSEWLFYYSSSW